ncbi:MAG: 4'-phosphopantetheinyl transferase superfamily protein [Candidatus Moraniibacteriota bacterium]
MHIAIAQSKNISPSYFSKSELDELEKLADYRKADWLASRLAVKKALRRFFSENQKKIVLNEIRIISRKSSRPSFEVKGKKYLNIAISLAHSNGIGVGAVSETELIGVDVENIRKFSEEFKAGFLTEKELRWFKKVKKAENDRIATLFWCIKEAYLKALGRGLKKHPRELEIRSKNGSMRYISIQDKGILTNATVSWSISDGYAVAAVIIHNDESDE